MNDFTKDELNIIYLDMTIYAKNAPPLKESPIHLELRNKIQTMIDNYCDHKSLEFVGDVYGYDCKKCDKRFDYNHVGEERHEKIINAQDGT